MQRHCGIALFGTLLLALSQAACAEVYDLDTFKKSAGPDARMNLVKNGDFENGMANWKTTPGDKAARGFGRNGSGGFIHERSNPAVYFLPAQSVPTKPGRRYEFGAWLKAKDLKGADKKGGAICIEFHDKDTGKYVSGVYPGGGVKGNEDWKLITGKFFVPENATTSILLYMRPKMTGTVYFDDVYIRPAGDVWAAYISYPTHNTITDRSPELKINVVRNGDLPPKNLKLAVQLELENGFKIAAPVDNGQAEIDLTAARLVAGKTLKCKMFVLDLSRKWLLHETSMPLRVRSEQANVPAGRVSILPNGVAVVDGKRFMPLGFFTSSVTPTIIKRLVDSGCNTVMPYGTVFNSRGKPDSIYKMLNSLHASNLKLIFSLHDFARLKRGRYTPAQWQGKTDITDILEAIVTEFKDHPALLAWFTNDEYSISLYSNLKEVRERVNRIDPHHPVWGVLYQFIELPNYGPTTDIIGVDPYTIKHGHMQHVRFAMQQAQKNRQPIWVVPEAFNNSIYAPGKWKTPTEQQMRSMALQMAGMGAKGFIFYKLDDNWSPKLPKDHFAKFWPGMCKVLKVMRELEPYILSDHAIKTVPVKTISGEVDAFLLTNDEGKEVIIVTSVRGEGEAILAVGKGTKWRSKYGKTSEQKNGVLRFRGGSIDSDVLFRE